MARIVVTIIAVFAFISFVPSAGKEGFFHGMMAMAAAIWLYKFLTSDDLRATE